MTSVESDVRQPTITPLQRLDGRGGSEPRLPFQAPCATLLSELPAWLWAEKRRKRSYVNQVLARAELDSGYEPARRLWARSRNGYYFPNPQMQLRVGAAWQPVYELALDWIDTGCGREGHYLPRPSESIDWVCQTAERSEFIDTIVAEGKAIEMRAAIVDRTEETPS